MADFLRRERYLKQALEYGLIEMTISDKPNGHLQKYCTRAITDCKSKALLSADGAGKRAFGRIADE